MTTWKKKQGDVNDTITVTLSGVEDLTAVSSVEAHVSYHGTTSTLTAAVTDPVDRVVTVQLGGVAGWLATAEQAKWSVETQVTFADGSILTWPSEGYDTLIVTADLA